MYVIIKSKPKQSNDYSAETKMILEKAVLQTA